MAVHEIDRASEVLTKVINHFIEHHEEYDSDTLEESMRIMQLDSFQDQQQLQQLPSYIIQQVNILEEETEPENSVKLSEDTISSDEEERFNSNMNRTNYPDPDSPQFFKEEPGVESSRQGAERNKKRKATKPIFMPSQLL